MPRLPARTKGGSVREPFVNDPDFQLYVGDVRDVLRELPAESVDCCVTSPPYWGLRDYGHEDQIGLEDSPAEYVASLVAVFAEVRRVLKPTGTLWLNLGDTYAGNRSYQVPQTLHGGTDVGNRRGMTVSPRRDNAPIPRSDMLVAGLKPKDLIGIPWRVALALQEDGWWLRSDIVWSKPNPMPESVTDRPTKSHEYVFLLTKGPRYFFDADAVREPYKYDGRTVTHVEGRDGSAQYRNGERWPGLKPRSSGNKERKPNPAAVLGRGDTSHGIPWVEGVGRNIRSVWEIATQPYPDAHFAVYPEALPERCIKAGCPEGGTVLDPFMGSGTTALVARRLGRRSIGIELNEEYAALAAKRLQQLSLFAGEAA